MTDAAATDAAPRIEIKTLVQGCLEDEQTRADYDRAFAEALNAGWEVLNITVTTGGMSANGSEWDFWLSHTRIVTLHRLVEADEAPEAASVEAETPETLARPDGVNAVIETLMAIGGDLLQPVDASRIHDTPVPETLGSIIPQHVVAVNIGFAEAYSSGRYTLAELRVIAEREIQQSGLDAFASWQPQINPVTGQQWEGLRFDHLTRNLDVLAMSDGG